MVLPTTKTAFWRKLMLRALKALPLTLALAALSLFASSCGTSTTQVRFVNAIPDTLDYGGGNGALDLQFNGTTEFSNIPFLNASGSTYKSVPAGSDTIKGFEAGSTTNQVFSQTLSLNSGKQYTVVATGSAANGGSNVVLLSPVDNNTAPALGNVNFRFINASPSGPNGSRAAADIYILPVACVLGSTGCTPAISALAYQNSASATLPFNSQGTGWLLIVTVAGNTTPIINASIGNFGSASLGAICTLVLTDQQNVPIMNTTPMVLQDLNASGCTVN
jgi:hypothetical protein